MKPEMSKNAKIAEFISFCMEEFKVQHHLSGKQIMNLFQKNGVIEYLYDFYDALHTQGKTWLVTEIAVFLNNRGVKP